MAALVAMLAEDAVITKPPMPTRCRGRAGVEAVLRDVAFARRREDSAFVPMALQVLTRRGAELTEIAGFVTPGRFGTYDPPDRLTAPDR